MRKILIRYKLYVDDGRMDLPNWIEPIRERIIKVDPTCGRVRGEHSIKELIMTGIRDLTARLCGTGYQVNAPIFELVSAEVLVAKKEDQT